MVLYVVHISPWSIMQALQLCSILPQRMLTSCFPICQPVTVKGQRACDTIISSFISTNQTIRIICCHQVTFSPFSTVTPATPTSWVFTHYLPQLCLPLTALYTPTCVFMPSAQLGYWRHLLRRQTLLSPKTLFHAMLVYCQDHVHYGKLIYSSQFFKQSILIKRSKVIF